MRPFELEICSYNLQSALAAQRAGADRVELCIDPAGGGVTPSWSIIRAARERLQLQLFPIIRPRGGDFLYNDDEYALMKEEILRCRELGCDGVVIGMLLADGRIDKHRCAKLVELAYPMDVTFHRAFDRCLDPLNALEDVIQMGCQRILTSGQRITAVEGKMLLTELVSQAAGRITIMAGAGVRSHNIPALADGSGLSCFHSSAAVAHPSGMQYVNHAMNENADLLVSDEEEIRNMISVLEKLFTPPL